MEPTEPDRSKGGVSVRIVLAIAVTLVLAWVTLRSWPEPDPALARITFDLSGIDEDGLYGPPDGKRSRAYEFCIPADSAAADEVRSIDSTVELSRSPGRIGCGEDQLLAIGNTGQPGWMDVLIRLASLPYVSRIEPFYGE